jgi:WD40 repeat protein
LIFLLLASGPAAGAQDQPPVARLPVEMAGEALPAGATLRLGTMRFRHDAGRLTGLAFTPDEACVVAAGEEHSVFVWETATGRLLRRFNTEPLSIRGFALSPDGRQIAVAGFWYDGRQKNHQRQVWILDAATGERRHTIERADRSLDRHAMAFTPDGKFLISVGTAGNIYIEEVASGVEILRQRIPPDNGPQIAISPDGSQIAVCSGPNTGQVLLWKWHAGEEPRALKVADENRVSGSLVFSPDIKLLAASLDHADFPLHIWDTATGELLQRTAIPTPDAYLHGTLLFSTDGNRLLAPGWRSNSIKPVALHQWNPHSGVYLGARAVRVGALLALSPSGRRLASNDGAAVRLWRWSSLEAIEPEPDGHWEAVNKVVSTPAGRIVTGSDDGTVCLWDATSGRLLRRLKHDHWGRDVAVSPDGRLVASSSLDDTVRLWELASGREVYRLPGHGRLGGLRTVAFSPDGQTLLSFGDDFFLRTWDVRTGKALAEYRIRPSGVKLPDDVTEPAPFEAFLRDKAVLSPDGRLLAVACDKCYLFDTATTRELHALDKPGSTVMGLAISPDGRFLLASSWGQPVETKLVDGRTLHSLGEDNPIALWDVSSGALVHLIVHREGAIGPVAFSPDSRRFAVAAARPRAHVVVYETATGRPVQRIDELPSRAAALGFSSDGKSLLAGLADTTVVAWPLDE